MDGHELYFQLIHLPCIQLRQRFKGSALLYRCCGCLHSWHFSSMLFTILMTGNRGKLHRWASRHELGIRVCAFVRVFTANIAKHYPLRFVLLEPWATDLPGLFELMFTFILVIYPILFPFTFCLFGLNRFVRKPRWQRWLPGGRHFVSTNGQSRKLSKDSRDREDWLMISELQCWSVK